MRFLALTTALALVPTLALAVGFDDDTPPETTPTSTECSDGQIYDADAETCVDAQDSRLGDDKRYGAVRELAYAGQYDRALLVLTAMTDQDQSRVWTYKGFIARKTGDQDAANLYYDKALQADADNLLARSYMGQGLVEAGEFAAARIQLSEIRARGGRNTWPEYALRTAISSGRAASY